MIHITEANTELEVESTQTAVIYDEKDGRVRHVHRIVNFRGADVRSCESIEKEAFEMAQRVGTDTDRSQVMLVDENAIEPLTEYRVDTQHRKLVVERRLDTDETNRKPPEMRRDDDSD